MALKLELNNKATIEVVCFQDDALQMTRDQYDNYLEDVEDKGRLHFKPGKAFEDCCRFVMRKMLPYRATQRILDQQISATTDGEGKDRQVKTQFSLKYVLEEVRAALVDIKGDGPEYKKGSDGYASEELVAGLYAAKVMGDLHTAWTNSRGEKVEAEAQRK